MALIVANRPRVTTGATGKPLAVVFGTTRVPVTWLWQGQASVGAVTVWDGGWQRDGQTSAASNGKRSAVLGAICERPWAGQPSHSTGSWWRDGQWLPGANMRWLLADQGSSYEFSVFSGEANWPVPLWLPDVVAVATVSQVGVQAGDWFKVTGPTGIDYTLTAVLASPGANDFVTVPTNDVQTTANLVAKLNSVLPMTYPLANSAFAHLDSGATFFVLRTTGGEWDLKSGQTVNGSPLACPRIICSSERTIGSPDQPAGITHMRSTLLGLPSGTLPALEAELLGDFHRPTSVPYSLDADPADVLVNLMVRAGWEASDVVVNLGGDGLADSSYRRWCTAQGFFVSRAVLSTINVQEAVRDLLADTWSTGFESGGKFIVRPLGTKPVPGPLGNFTPDTSPAIPITIDDLTEPIVVERLAQSGDTATRNAFPVTFRDRDADYQESTVEQLNDAHAQAHKVLRADPTAAPWVTRADHALRLSSLMAQRSEQVRNKFRLSIRPEIGALLEPCDKLAITDSVWGVTAQLCRVRSVEWQDGKGYLVVAEDIPDHSPIAVASTRFSADGLAGSAPPPYAYGAGTTALLSQAKSRRVGGVAYLMITDGETQGELVFDVPQPDTDYFVAVTPLWHWGVVATPGIFQVNSITKSTTGFTFTVEEAPQRSGNMPGFVRFDYTIISQGAADVVPAGGVASGADATSLVVRSVGSAISRSLGERFSNEVDVADFVDLVTVGGDWSPAIQRAIDVAIIRGARRVCLPVGVQARCDHSINLQGVFGMEIVGGGSGWAGHGGDVDAPGINYQRTTQLAVAAGGSTRLIANCSGRPLFDCLGACRLSFSDFSVHGQDAAAAFLLTRAFYPADYPNTGDAPRFPSAGTHTFDRVPVDGAWSKACVVSISSEGNTFTSCNLTNTADHAFAFWTYPDALVPGYASNDFRNAAIGSDFRAIPANQLGGNTMVGFRGCEIVVTGAGSSCVFGAFTGMEMSNCYTNAGPASHSAFRITYGLQHSSISGHRDESTSPSGIYLEAGAKLNFAKIVGSYIDRAIYGEDGADIVCSEIVDTQISWDATGPAGPFAINVPAVHYTRLMVSGAGILVRSEAVSSEFPASGYANTSGAATLTPPASSFGVDRSEEFIGRWGYGSETNYRRRIADDRNGQLATQELVASRIRRRVQIVRTSTLPASGGNRTFADWSTRNGSVISVLLDQADPLIVSGPDLWAAPMANLEVYPWWQAPTTYALGARVNYGSHAFMSLQNGNAGHAPVEGGTAYWQDLNVCQAGFPEWDFGTTYALDDRVTASGRNYRSRANSNQGHHPGWAAWWEFIGPTGGGDEGSEVTFLFTQDGVGGRAVYFSSSPTWCDQWIGAATHNWYVNPTAGATSSITFIADPVSGFYVARDWRAKGAGQADATYNPANLGECASKADFNALLAKLRSAGLILS